LTVKEHAKRRPAETSAGSLGTLGALVQALAGTAWWKVVIVLAVGYAPGAVTYMGSHGGLLGVAKDILHGNAPASTER
jgi:hypothetical protein